MRLTNGIEIPSLGLGTWQLPPDNVYDLINEAINVGYRHIDCSPVYMNEKEIGSSLSKIFSLGDINREQV